MRRTTLLTATLISVLSLSACAQREVTKIDPLDFPIEETQEPVKPAEPILITVVPEAEVEDEDNNIEISADIDYYGKEEASQPAPSTPNSGFPATNPSQDANASQSNASTEVWQGGGNGIPTERRSWGTPYTGGTW